MRVSGEANYGFILKVLTETKLMVLRISGLLLLYTQVESFLSTPNGQLHFAWTALDFYEEISQEVTSSSYPGLRGLLKCGAISF